MRACRYTRDGLRAGVHALKNGDLAVGQVLKALEDQGVLSVHIALVKRTDTGYGDEGEQGGLRVGRVACSAGARQCCTARWTGRQAFMWGRKSQAKGRDGAQRTCPACPCSWQWDPQLPPGRGHRRAIGCRNLGHRTPLHVAQGRSCIIAEALHWTALRCDALRCTALRLLEPTHAGCLPPIVAAWQTGLSGMKPR